MKLKSIRVPAAAVAAIGAAALLFGAASAQTPAPVTYTANLAPVPLNGATGASGTVKLVLNGNQATITQSVSGLADVFNNAPFPHVQHIHGGAMGMCPVASADANSDGVLSTTEGGPSYGGVQTTLSVTGDTTPAAATNVMTAPSGPSYEYSRTIMLDAATITSLQTGKAVIVVHGIDPAKAAPAATTSPSDLVPSLPLAATSPALCGVMVAASTSGVGSFATTPVYSSNKLGSAVLLGGSVAQLDATLVANGGSGAWAQDSSGTFVLYIVGGGFVNDRFKMAFTAGMPNPIALTVVGK